MRIQKTFGHRSNEFDIFFAFEWTWKISKMVNAKKSSYFFLKPKQTEANFFFFLPISIVQ